MLSARRNIGLERIRKDLRCNIGRAIGYSVKDDELPARLALESATLFLHGLFAGRAQRCHCVTGTPDGANSFNALINVTKGCKCGQKSPLLGET
jgi:hypothetical protein